MLPSTLEIFLAIAIAVLLVCFVYIAASRSRDRFQARFRSDPTQLRTAVFLFDKEELVDATNLANWLIDEKFDHMSDWDALLLLLNDDFPSVEDKLSGLEEGAAFQLSSLFDHNLQLLISKINGRVRMELRGIDPGKTPDLIQKLEQKSKRIELNRLRSITDSTPQLIWQEDRNGDIIWCNQTYLRFVDLKMNRQTDEPRMWPSKKLFPDLRRPEPHSALALQSRQSLNIEDEAVEHWFSVASFPNEEGVVHFASDANDEIRSERSQKAFIQTFAKTFAQLSVGLAIFDKSRNLTMFNPAMLEMAGLPISFMSTRPSIETVFDRMRAIGKLPEPKDYVSWRDRFISMMDQKRRDGYQDTWALSDGQVYRVTGRPHPDGAFAFLFEDISAEVSLTRRFRTEIETTQAVLDSLVDPIAVFSPSQTLVLTNQAYFELWNEPSEEVAAPEMKIVLKSWKQKSAPTSIWTDLEAFAAQAQGRNAWSSEFLLKDGRIMICQVSPLPGGMTLVKFSLPAKVGPSSQNQDMKKAVVAPSA